jgi:predicted transcriptional regulator
LGEFNLGNYRGKLDIIADILQVAKENAKKTQIMYQANLSYKVLQRYLAKLIKASLICFENEKRCYMLTNKGRKFLEAYKRYSITHKSIESKLNEAYAKRKVLEKLCKGE